MDPYVPTSTPVKRTALGRFAHEGAAVQVNEDGRVVIYMADDKRYEYLYRFVSDGRYDATERESNFGLLDQGVLSVAMFSGDGTLRWLPLQHGRGNINENNGFYSQADVMIEARSAADLAGPRRWTAPKGLRSAL